MADNTTGLPVQTLSGQFVSTKLVDSGGTNVAAVSAAGRLSVDASGATVPVSDAAGSLTVDAPLGTPLGVQISDGSVALIGQKAKAGSIPVTLASDEDSVAVTGTFWQATQPVSIAATVSVDSELPTAAALADNTANPTVPGVGSYLMGFDGTTWDRVQVNGSGQLEVEIVAGASSGTEYVGDAAATATPTGVMGMGLASASAPAGVSADNDAVAAWFLRNGSQVVNLASGGTLVTLGQGTKAASLPVTLASDEDTVNVTAANLQVDVNQIIGSAPGAANPLPVRLTDGAAFYQAAGDAPGDPQYGTQTSAALGAGSNVVLNHYVTSGKTGQLQGVDAGSTVPCKVEILTIVTGTPTVRSVFFTKSFEVLQWRSPHRTYITQASSDTTTGFGVRVTNKDAAVAADVYSTAYWNEV